MMSLADEVDPSRTERLRADEIERAKRRDIAIVIAARILATELLPAFGKSGAERLVVRCGVLKTPEKYRLISQQNGCHRLEGHPGGPTYLVRS